VVTNPLVEDDRKLGGRAWKALHADSVLGLRAAYWWFSEDADRWFFTIAATACETSGPRAAYLRARQLLEAKKVILPLSRIAMTVPNDPIIAHLRKMIPGGKSLPLNFYVQNLSSFGFEIIGVFVYQI
jgi:hypothetical protein